MGSDGLKKLPAIFYRTMAGAEPVRDWLKELTDKDRRIVGGDIARAEFGCRSACRYAAPSAAVCGKSGAACRMAASLA